MINFIGWFGRKNVGDVAFVEALKLLMPDRELVHSEGRLAPGAEHYVLGPGDVIKPPYLQTLGDKPFSIMGAGLGYESEVGLLKGKSLKAVLLRNYEDVQIAQAAGISQAKYCPDFAFALPPPERDPNARRRKKKRAVVILSDAVNASYTNGNPSKLHYAEYLKWTLAGALSELGQWYDFEFLPFSEEKNDYDLRCHIDVFNRMESDKPVKVLHKAAPTVAEAMQIITDADLVITMKFHGVIFSTACGRPFVNIGLTRKTQTFCVEHNLQALCVPAYGFTHESFMKAVKVAEMEFVSLKLRQIAKRKREILWDPSFLNGVF